MEMNERNSFELGKNGYHHHLGFHGPGFLPESGAPASISPGTEMAPSSPRALLAPASSFPPGLWNLSAQGFALGEATAGAPFAGHPFSSLPGTLPAGLSHIPADSGFIERAARLSCFNGGNLEPRTNHPFASEPLGSFHCAATRKNEVSVGEGCKGASVGNEHGEQRDMESSHGVGASNNDSGEPESSGGGGQEESPNLAAAAKKRKRPGQDTKMNQVEGTQELPPETAKEKNDNHESGEPKRLATTSGKSNGKQGKDTGDAAKEDYIHVRARRGQATNSHSLAERVRRERISERMKFLQDLVPGCNKVTGKAVMLDEIINYVQSLQRQVEFLSMKLAAVNPRLDFNIEGILTKDLFQSQGGPSSTIGFLPDIVHPELHPSQLVQAGLPGITNTPDAFRRVITAQVGASSGYKEPMQQTPNAWEGEFLNMMQMPFTPLSNQELSSKPRDGFLN